MIPLLTTCYSCTKLVFRLVQLQIHEHPGFSAYICICIITIQKCTGIQTTEFFKPYQCQPRNNKNILYCLKKLQTLLNNVTKVYLVFSNIQVTILGTRTFKDVFIVQQVVVDCIISCSSQTNHIRSIGLKMHKLKNI